MNVISWDKMQVKHKVGLFGLGALVIVYCTYIFLLMPEWTRIDELITQYNIEQQQVKVIENFVVIHPSPEQYIHELDNKIQQADKMLPDTSELSSFLLELEQLSKDSGVQLVNLKPTKSINKEGYREIEVEILVNGKFPNVMNFLNKIENGSRFINVTSIGMQLGKNGLDGKIVAKIYSYGVAPVATNNPSDVKK